MFKKRKNICSDGNGEAVHGVDHAGVGCSVVVRVVSEPVVEGAGSQGEGPGPASGEGDSLEVCRAEGVEGWGGRDGRTEVLRGDPQDREDHSCHLRLGLV